MADIHNRLAHGPHQGGMMDGAVCLFIYFTYHINGLKKSKGDVQPDPEHPQHKWESWEFNDSVSAHGFTWLWFFNFILRNIL